MSDKLLVSRQLTESQEAAFWAAWDQYQEWKRDEVFPRPILPAHLWDALVKDASSGQAILDDCASLKAEVERLREAERTAWEPPPAWERPFNFECLGWVYGGWDFVFWNDTHWVTRKGNPCTPGHFRPMPPAPKQEPH